MCFWYHVLVRLLGALLEAVCRIMVASRLPLFWEALLGLTALLTIVSGQSISKLLDWSLLPCREICVCVLVNPHAACRTVALSVFSKKP